ncbi:MAG: peptide chain release factor N(5)-glutamine methyltransferase, partial [Peptococcaceae bacterium]|nr:peptide chain release factor N(5)-glutamine methyltransferase [Peptococcaceae bacterium]
MITIREALSFAGLRLKKEGGQSSALDVAVLLGFVTGLNRAELYRNWQRVLTPEEENRFDNLLTRRAAGEPVAYLTGRKEFMGLEFYVTPTVLIPRPETELMVEKAVSLLDNDGGILVDAGTGSGAIAVSLAVMLPRTVIYATDISLLALEIAGQNSRKHGVERRVFLRQGDLLASLTEDNLAGKIDLV